MTRASNLICHATHLLLLRGVSLMVPFAQRAEWRQEWLSELWHVRRSCQPVGAFSWTAERELMAFCLGSFQDAACLRRHKLQLSVASASVHGSARQCVLWLCTLLALCAILARLLPGIRSEQDASRNPFRAGVLLLQKAQSEPSAQASISFSEYEDWKTHPQRFFTDLAFYRTERMTAQTEGADRSAWLVARASRNLFTALGLDVGGDAPVAEANVARAVLSQSMWRSQFDSDPSIVGQVIKLDHRKIRIVGVAPAAVNQLPGHADVWVLEPDALLARTPQSAAGHVIAQLSPAGDAEVGSNLTWISTYTPDGDETGLFGSRFAPPAIGIFPIYLFALFLAVLSLPAITSVFQSEENFASHQPSLKARMKRWMFLAVKIALVVALGFFAALDIAYANFADYAASAEFLQFWASFLICLFGLRWALVDQSRRCPVCLRRVTHPAQVGIASCNFLGWNGTEMICMGGHALLHVPSLPTSWFSRQRWMYLDTSWDFLFADTVGRP